MADKSKIIAKDVDVWIADTGTAGTPPDATNMTDAGWYRRGTIKLTPTGRNEEELQGGGKHKLSIEYQLEFNALETPLASVQALEAFEDSDGVDILLVDRNDKTKGDLYTNMSFIVEPDFDLSGKVARSLKLTATRSAKKLSDFMSEETALVGF